MCVCLCVCVFYCIGLVMYEWAKFVVVLHLPPSRILVDPVPQQPISEGLSDSEEEIDFGFWEKAPDPASKKTAAVTQDKVKEQPRQSDTIQEADLDLL